MATLRTDAYKTVSANIYVIYYAFGGNTFCQSQAESYTARFYA